MLSPRSRRSNKYIGIHISRELRDIIHGYIMSDGYVKKDGILTVDQGVKQEKFVLWLYEKLKPLITRTSQVKAVYAKNSTQIKSFRFNTRALLPGFHRIWYKEYEVNGRTNYKKGFPKNIKCFFSPFFVAVWYAGNGTKIIGSKGVKFEVTSFTPDERKRLKNLFKTKYDIDTVINRAGQSKSGKDQWTLNINAKDYPKFHALITKMNLIPTLFPYKLHPAF